MSLAIGRRPFLFGMATAVLLVRGAAEGFAASGPMPRRMSAPGRFLGTSLRFDQLAKDSALRDAVLQDCDMVTPEVDLKWAAIQPARNRFNYRPVDELIAFSTDNRLRVHGHTLLWEQSIPDWARADLAQDEPDWDVVGGYFRAVLGRYSGAVDTWDVINEPIETSHRADGLRANSFLRAFGPDYIPRALREARAAAPRARLLLNEYSFEYGNPVDEARRNAMLRLLGKLRAADIPLDGLGMQAHLDLAKGPLATRALRRFMQNVADLGLDLYVTELDVRERNITLPVAKRDQLVADETKRYLAAVLDQPAVKGITTWGLSDRYSWLIPPRADAVNRGLPYNSDLQPKPMYFVLRDALANLQA